ncbi:MAG: alpha/beta fold hydrolase [Gammaproteobacteria bacterium]|nr:alpha/beta fold hydrolase [Gammaproteobacteria bacterium]
MKFKSLLFFLLVVSNVNCNACPASNAGHHQGFQLIDATISSVHKAIKSRQLTCEQLVRMYINRIKKYDLDVTNGPPLNAIVNINPSVIDEARKIDKTYARTNKFIGPLHCVPVILKDNFDSYDSTTTAGSLSLLGSQPNKDAFIVAKLRHAGAIILGKAGMDEFASGMSGISSRSGRIGNAYDPNNNPGGSSGGPAVAVSANFALIGMGTDNGGSVRIPAAFNGIYGLRPSTGLLSQSGIFPGGNLDGTAGPLTRTVQDLARVLSVIAQPDPNDPKTVNVPRVNSYNAYLDKNGFKGKRIGIVRSVAGLSAFGHTSKQVSLIYKKAFAEFRQLGATVVDNIRLPKFDNNREYNTAGSVQDINAYLGSFHATRKSFRDICLSNRTRTYGSIRKCLKVVKNMPKKYGKKYNMALKIFAKNMMYVEKIMRRNDLDALVMPISQVGYASYNIEAVNTWKLAVSSNSGLPAMTINISYAGNNKVKMPVGVELITKKYDEPTLIAMSYAYAIHNKPRSLPRLKEPKRPSTLTRLTIPQMNNLFADIGKQAYAKILQNHDESALTGTRFRKMVSNVLPRFVQGRYTKIGNVQIYSEYYPNPGARFKGTIIFENGSGTPLTEWTQNKNFFRCVRQLGNLFMYDRSGLGKSPADLSMSQKKPMTAKLINRKLMRLLKSRKIRPPYILVAHSYGGLYAGYFARKFPRLVKGLLMVDSVPNNYEWSDAFINQRQKAMKIMSKLTSKQLYRQYSYANAERLKTMPAQLYYQLLGFKQTKAQINKLPALSSKIPVIIVSSSFMGKNGPIKGSWYKKQQQWLNNNPNSKIIRVHSGHWIQLEHPKLICKQLREVANLAIKTRSK